MASIHQKPRSDDREKHEYNSRLEEELTYKRSKEDQEFPTSVRYGKGSHLLHVHTRHDRYVCV